MINQWGPNETPKVILHLIIWTCVISILSGLTNSLFVQILKMNGPQEILGLSWYGLRQYYLWQPVTYIFIKEVTAYGISVNFLISLAFDMYILWVIGTMIQERIGTNRFLGVYLLSGVVAGIIAILMMLAVGKYMLITGPAAALLAIFTLWTMFYPENILMLFFLIPVKTMWLLVAVLAIITLTTLSSGDFVSLIFYWSGALFGYLYGLLYLGLKSPFKYTHEFDTYVINKMEKFRSRKESGGGTKVVDFSESIDDDAFMDAMLTKIAKYGESSLTARERQRMKQISERRDKRT